MLGWKREERSGKPVYRQISDHIIKLVRQGSLKEGARLPSERNLAKSLEVSRNTIDAAIAYLQENGFVRRMERKGTVITGEALRRAAPAITPNWKKLEKRGRNRVAEEGFISSKGYREGIYHLTRRHVYGKLNFAEYFFTRVGQSSLDFSPVTSESATDWRGMKSLRESLAVHMERMGVKCSPDQILVCASITQALNTIANIFLNVDVTYYHERASFINLKSIMKASGGRFEGLEMDREGVVLDKLKNRLHPPKNAFLHLHINNHNPTGITASPERRQEIMAVCRKWGIPVIEMDSMRGMYHLQAEPPTLKQFDRNGSVIYIGSFLRPTSEMMGLAWIVADEYVVDCISKMKQPLDTHPNLMAQLIADNVLRSGLFYTYLGDLRQHLAFQLEALNTAMDKHIGDIAVWDHRRSSHYLWPEFEAGINIKKAYFLRKDVDFNPGFFYDPRDKSHISVTTLAMGADKFDEAFKRLRRLIDTAG